LIFARSGFHDGKPTYEVIRLRPLADGNRIEFRTDCLLDTALSFRMGGILSRSRK